VQQIPGKVTEPGPKEEAGLLAADDLGAHLLPAAAAPRRHLRSHPPSAGPPEGT
jgi:hypothetical protein